MTPVDDNYPVLEVVTLKAEVGTSAHLSSCFDEAQRCLTGSAGLLELSLHQALEKNEQFLLCMLWRSKADLERFKGGVEHTAFHKILDQYVSAAEVINYSEIFARRVSDPR